MNDAGGGHGRFTDAEEYQTSLPDLKTELVVTQSGVFGAQLTWAKLPNLHLLRAQETLARVAYITLPEPPVVVSFSTGAGQGLIWNGVQLGPGEVVFHSRGEHLHQRTTGPSHWGFLSIAPTFFARLGSAFAGRDLAPPALGRIVRPLPADLARLLRRCTPGSATWLRRGQSCQAIPRSAGLSSVNCWRRSLPV